MYKSLALIYLFRWLVKTFSFYYYCGLPCIRFDSLCRLEPACESWVVHNVIILCFARMIDDSYNAFERVPFIVYVNISFLTRNSEVDCNSLSLHYFLAFVIYVEKAVKSRRCILCHKTQKCSELRTFGRYANELDVIKMQQCSLSYLFRILTCDD